MIYVGADLRTGTDATRHCFFTSLSCGKLVPDLVNNARYILDVGTGTGDWVLYEICVF